MNKSYLAAAAIALLAIFWIIGGDWQSQPAGEEIKTQAVPTETRAEADVIPHVLVTHSIAALRRDEVEVKGRSKASRIVDLKAQTTSRIIETLKNRGDLVKTGDAIVRLAMEDRAAKLASVKALVTQREKEFKAAEALSSKGFRAETQLAESKANLEKAKADLAAIQTDIGFTTIKAPFDGILAERYGELGDVVAVNQTIAQLVDLDPIMIAGQISEQKIGDVSLGLPARAILSTKQELLGQISYLSPSADPETRTFRVEMTAANPDHQITDGLTAELIIPTKEVYAHKVSPAILTLLDDGTVGVKSVDAQNIVRFHPVELIRDKVEGIWIKGLPREIDLITVGQEFAEIGKIARVTRNEEPKEVTP